MPTFTQPAEKHKIIHDPLYGDIRISPQASRIIATPCYERLGNINQTSMAYRVFPSARHTRFAHQIGVYGLTKMTLRSLEERELLEIVGTAQTDNHPLTPLEMILRINRGERPRITKEEAEWICIGGLLHDLGHGPASHTFDDLIEEFIDEGRLNEDCIWKTHEERSQYMFHELVSNEPDHFGFTPTAVEYICNVINPPPHLKHDFRFQFINNEINGVDLDKMDYIARDQYVFGLNSQLDVRRIITNSSICVDARTGNNERDKRHLIGIEIGEGTYWSFGCRTRDDIFTLFMTRYRLYRDIYNHPKVIKFELAYKDALRDSQNEIIDAFLTCNVDAFNEMTDDAMLWRASNEARMNFVARDTYIMLSAEEEADEDLAETHSSNITIIEETVGFFGKSGFNPFDHIRFHKRGSNKIVILKPNEINIFLTFDCHSETIRYVYRKNDM